MPIYRILRELRESIKLHNKTGKEKAHGSTVGFVVVRRGIEPLIPP